MNINDGRVVYFIQRGDHDGPVKVGFSDNPQGRLEQLQTGHFETLYLIGTTPGGVAKEREIHTELAEFSLGREWFSPSDALFKFIESPTPNLGHAIAATRMSREHVREAIAYFAIHGITEARSELELASRLIQDALDHLSDRAREDVS